MSGETKARAWKERAGNGHGEAGWAPRRCTGRWIFQRGVTNILKLQRAGSGAPGERQLCVSGTACRVRRELLPLPSASMHKLRSPRMPVPQIYMHCDRELLKLDYPSRRKGVLNAPQWWGFRPWWRRYFVTSLASHKSCHWFSTALVVRGLGEDTASG